MRKAAVQRSETLTGGLSRVHLDEGQWFPARGKDFLSGFKAKQVVQIIYRSNKSFKKKKEVGAWRKSFLF